MLVEKRSFILLMRRVDVWLLNNEDDMLIKLSSHILDVSFPKRVSQGMFTSVEMSFPFCVLLTKHRTLCYQFSIEKKVEKQLVIDVSYKTSVIHEVNILDAKELY